MSDQEMRDRLTKLETTVGETAADGLRRDIAEIKDNVRLIFERIAASERRFAMMLGGGLVVVWILERVWK